MRYVIAVYERDRLYGGPEEGGWWYDTGQKIRTIAVVAGEEAAYAMARRVNRLLEYRDDFYNRVRISSVAYQGGELRVRVYKGTAPDHYPEERPYYE